MVPPAAAPENPRVGSSILPLAIRRRRDGPLSRRTEVAHGRSERARRGRCTWRGRRLRPGDHGGGPTFRRPPSARPPGGPTRALGLPTLLSRAPAPDAPSGTA